ILTDCQPVLELRRSIATPVVWLAVTGDRSSPGLTLSGGEASGLDASNVSESPDAAIADTLVTTLSAGNIFCHPRFASDKPMVRRLIDRLTETLDLAEPFARIREAIGEARKM